MRSFRGSGALFRAVVLITALLWAMGTNAGEPSRKVRIIYTNDTLGWLAPCGCPGRGQGGLAVRAKVLADLIKENPNTVIVESGNLSDQADKLGLITSVLVNMHYDAVGVGVSDLSMADEFFKQAPANKLTVLDASPGARECTRPYIVKNVDGVKVGVVSLGAQAPGADTNEYARRKALYSAFKAAREASDILVALDQANLVSRDWVERNGKRLGAPDVVVGGTAGVRMLSADEVGQAHLVQTSSRNAHVGVVDIEVTQGQPLKYTFQRIALNPAVGEDEAVAKRVKDFLAGLHRETASAARQQPTGSIPPQYFHPLGCRACHDTQYDDWKASKHARAIKTLADQQRVIPECMKCHSEDFRKTRAVSVPRDGIGGVDCVSCHKVSMPHWVDRPASGLAAKVDPKVCIECHTPEHSAKYEEKSYMARITHRNADPAEPVAIPAPPPAMK